MPEKFKEISAHLKNSSAIWDFFGAFKVRFIVVLNNKKENIPYFYSNRYCSSVIS